MQEVLMVAIDATKDALAAAYAELAHSASIHTTDPGTTGAHEATGGSPAYAREVLVWVPGAAGVVTHDPVLIDVPAGTYAWAGLWSLAGDFVDKVAIGPYTKTGQGQILLTDTFTQV